MSWLKSLMNGKGTIDMMSKYELKEQLIAGIVTVVFEKVDGTIREMQCTLNKEQMPPQLLTEEQNAAKVRTENPDLLSVWDVENNGWRSFRVSNVKEIR